MSNQVNKQYDNNKYVMHLACRVHSRLYFYEAKNQEKERVEYPLKHIQELYRIKREATDKTPEERKELRLEKALPIIKKLGEWMAKEYKVMLPKSLIGKAMAYIPSIYGINCSITFITVYC